MKYVGRGDQADGMLDQAKSMPIGFLSSDDKHGKRK